MAVSHAQAARFDCNKARSPMEKTICADMQLSALDDELNTMYKTTLERAGNKAVIRRWQRDWLKSYALSGCEDAACWRAQFAERIATLKNVAGSPDPAARWHSHYVRTLEGREDIHPDRRCSIWMVARPRSSWQTKASWSKTNPAAVGSM